MPPSWSDADASCPTLTKTDVLTAENYSQSFQHVLEILRWLNSVCLCSLSFIITLCKWLHSHRSKLILRNMLKILAFSFIIYSQWSSQTVCWQFTEIMCLVLTSQQRELAFLKNKLIHYQVGLTITLALLFLTVTYIVINAAIITHHNCNWISQIIFRQKLKQQISGLLGVF